MLMVHVVSAAEYVIDFGVISEKLRPLIELCTTSVPWSGTDRCLNRSVILSRYESSWSASELRSSAGVPKSAAFQG
jgi:hypothetical protein